MWRDCFRAVAPFCVFASRIFTFHAPQVLAAPFRCTFFAAQGHNRIYERTTFNRQAAPKARGWPEGKVIGLAKAAGETLQRNGLSRDEVLLRLDAVRENPRDFLEDANFGAVALETLRREVVEQARFDDKLRDAPLEFPIWGRDGIDIGAIAQMETSMALPITAAGALMPDAHIGYGLPIGGVLATTDAVIPYAVGVDIACRMKLSIYEMSPHVIGQHGSKLQRALRDNTGFGMAVEEWTGDEKRQHDVLDDAAWQDLPLLKGLRSQSPRRATRHVGQRQQSLRRVGRI